jgi:hypothetical protein
MKARSARRRHRRMAGDCRVWQSASSVGLSGAEVISSKVDPNAPRGSKPALQPGGPPRTTADGVGVRARCTAMTGRGAYDASVGSIWSGVKRRTARRSGLFRARAALTTVKSDQCFRSKEESATGPPTHTQRHASDSCGDLWIDFGTVNSVVGQASVIIQRISPSRS